MAPEAEGLAFQKLDKPITETATIRLKYRSGQKVGVTRNGALVVASKLTNSDSFKIGTVIGMNQHVAFAGGWGNVGSAAAKKASFAERDTFEIEVKLNVAKGTGSAVINGSSFNFSLPPNLKSVECVGFYAKATSTEFSAPVIE
jgi:arylsulfatase A